MDLSQMQGLWQDLSQKLDQQKQLTDTLIMEMTQMQYKAKFSKISTFESIGAVVCWIFTLGLIFNFHKLEIWYLQLSGVLCILILGALPIISLRSIYGLKSLNLADKSYRDTLLEFARRKKRFFVMQQVSFGLSPLLMVLSLPVFTKIAKDEDLFTGGTALFWYIPIMSLVLFFFYRWAIKCYRNINASAESLIKELDDTKDQIPLSKK